MKTKNMRKKALLSSVAMLLVAVIALSGATYAWFSANSTATLSGISFTTNKSSSLLMAVKTGTNAPTNSDYGSTKNLGITDMQLSPVSTTGIPTSNALAFFDVTASDEKADGTAQKVHAVNSLGSTADSKFVHKTLYFKADEQVGVKLAGVTLGNVDDLKTAIRIAIVNQSNQAKIYSITGSARSTRGIASIDNNYVSGSKTFGDFYTGTNFTGVTFDDLTAIAVTGSGAFVTLGENGAATSVDLYIWLEGNDEACDNALSGAALNGLTLQFDAVSS